MFASVLPHFIDNGEKVVGALKKADTHIQHKHNRQMNCPHSLALSFHAFLREMWRETVEKEWKKIFHYIFHVLYRWPNAHSLARKNRPAGPRAEKKSPKKETRTKAKIAAKLRKIRNERERNPLQKIARMHVIIQPAFSFGFNSLLFLSFHWLFSLRLLLLWKHDWTFSSIQSFNFYLQLINIVDLLRISQVLHIWKRHNALFP